MNATGGGGGGRSTEIKSVAPIYEIKTTKYIPKGISVESLLVLEGASFSLSFSKFLSFLKSSY